MKYLVLVIIFLLALVAPGSVFFFLSPWGIGPDLVMLWTIYMSLYSQPRGGLLGAFVMGFVTDLYIGSAVGQVTLVLCVVALISIWLRRRWNKEKVLPVTALVFLVSLAGQIALMVLAGLAGLGVAGLAGVAGVTGFEPSMWANVRVVFGVSLYNAVLVPLTFPPVRRLFARFHPHTATI
ncbi:MAG: rod shape-determining protein MreD [Peptococcaceae bacterium]|nr:rod shape-determining protein MreD [Peptococcaceae bacterium]